MGVTSQLAEFCAGIKLSHCRPSGDTGTVPVAHWCATSSAPGMTRRARASFVPPCGNGMATGNAGVFGDAARYSPVGAAVFERGAGALAGF